MCGLKTMLRSRLAHPTSMGRHAGWVDVGLGGDSYIRKCNGGRIDDYRRPAITIDTTNADVNLEASATASQSLASSLGTGTLTQNGTITLSGAGRLQRWLRHLH
jgi:hypothetical protein